MEWQWCETEEEAKQWVRNSLPRTFIEQGEAQVQHTPGTVVIVRS